MPPKTKTTARKTVSKTDRSPSAKPLRRGGTPGLAGRLTPEESRNLVLEAKDAFAYQTSLGRIEPGMSFDEWRRDMVMDRVGKEGISKLVRAEWPPVKILFLELAGREDEALKLSLKTGVKTYRPVDGNDTWESCEQYVALIRQKLAAHAAVTITHEKGHIHEGWFLVCARQRTGKPTLTMATLAERLDPQTLHGLLSHLGNHIATREGRADPKLRKKRVYPKKADPGEMDPPF